MIPIRHPDGFKHAEVPEFVQITSRAFRPWLRMDKPQNKPFTAVLDLKNGKGCIFAVVSEKEKAGRRGGKYDVDVLGIGALLHNLSALSVA